MRFVSLNRGVLYDERRCWPSHQCTGDAEWQRPTWSAGVSGWETGDDGPAAVAGKLLDDGFRCRAPVGLVAPAHLSNHEPGAPGERPGEPQLHQEPMETVRPLVHVLEKQDRADRR